MAKDIVRCPRPRMAAIAGHNNVLVETLQIGVLDDPELNAYVTEIGLKLLRGLPRRSFRYHFAVVDQTEPNAFALPGGYIFISRGLLILSNSEDELANVIGHEIVHVAARHAMLTNADHHARFIFVRVKHLPRRTFDQLRARIDGDVHPVEREERVRIQ